MSGTRTIGDGIPAQMTQVTNVGKLVALGALLLGLYLLVSGTIRLLRRGEVPRAKRYRPMMRIAFGVFPVALPGLVNWLTQATQPNFPITNTQQF